MTHSLPWFRIYSEILDDRKIKKICKKTGHSKALVIGVWVSLLALANDSPVRGTLSLSEDMPYTQEDIEDELGLPGEIINQLLDEFVYMGMINGKSTLKISNWEKRQFRSDNSTERVREYREKRANVTTMKRYNAVIDSEERRGDSEEIQNREEEETPEPYVDVTSLILPMICRVSGMASIPPKEMVRSEQLISMVQSYGLRDTEASLKRACDRWRKSPRKNGSGNYSVTNMGWVDWAQDELVGKVPVTREDLDNLTGQEYLDALMELSNDNSNVT